MDSDAASLPHPDTPVRPIQYRLWAARPEAHLFRVEVEITDPDPAGEDFSLPAWIPGSYLVRDFARHVVSLAAAADGRPVSARKTAKDTWRVAAPPGSRQLVLSYEVYAWDLSVRGAHFDTTHAFFNGSSVFLRCCGRERRPCEVEIHRPAGKAYAAWRLTTALPPLPGRPGSAARFRCADYAELIDHPVEMGEFDAIEFSARGVRHRVAISGRHDADLARLQRDLKKICDWQIAFWGKPLPIRDYHFLVTAVGDGYGGLEHRNSTALLCSRNDLPTARTAAGDERYRNFLGLASHEYFHTWLVKRIRPADFDELDLQRENPTELLWLFEGFTAYYDDLALRRCGLISESDYLATLGKTVLNVINTPGRFRQSVAEASYDAWLKYYRPDENTANTTISYYAKGALLALCLDLTIRLASDSRASLDDVMRRLWREFGACDRGVSERDLRRLAEEVAGKSLAAFFRKAVHGTGDLPLDKLFREFGLALQIDTDKTPGIGAKVASEGSDLRLATVFEGGAAQAAGLSGGDILVAIDGLRVLPGKLDALLARYRPGDTVTVSYFRRDELRVARVVVAAGLPTACRIVPDDRSRGAAKRHRNNWLN